MKGIQDKLEHLQLEQEKLSTAHGELEALNNKWAQKNVNIIGENTALKVGVCSGEVTMYTLCESHTMCQIALC